MELTEIKVFKTPVERGGKVKASVTIALDGCFVVHNIKIVEGASGTIIVMPSRRTNTGEYKEIIHPITSEFRKYLQQKILEKYEDDPVNNDIIGNNH